MNTLFAWQSCKINCNPKYFLCVVLILLQLNCHVNYYLSLSPLYMYTILPAKNGNGSLFLNHTTIRFTTFIAFLLVMNVVQLYLTFYKCRLRKLAMSFIDDLVSLLQIKRQEALHFLPGKIIFLFCKHIGVTIIL